MNFTYTLSKPQEGTFGRLSKDGTWNGMVRLLQDGDVDIGLLCVFFKRGCCNCRDFLLQWRDGKMRCDPPFAPPLQRCAVLL